MNFYDKAHELTRALKETNEYKEYIQLKKELKTNEEKYKMVKDFKDQQRNHQVKYINGQEVTKEELEHMQNLYSILIQDEKIRKLLECEMKIDVFLADMQKIVGEAVKEIAEF